MGAQQKENTTNTTEDEKTRRREDEKTRGREDEKTRRRERVARVELQDRSDRVRSRTGGEVGGCRCALVRGA